MMAEAAAVTAVALMKSRRETSYGMRCSPSCTGCDPPEHAFPFGMIGRQLDRHPPLADGVALIAGLPVADAEVITQVGRLGASIASSVDELADVAADRGVRRRAGRVSHAQR
jgi:hypothetical protein